MNNFERILIPTDFSDCAKNAIDFVHNAPWARDAEILLLHVFEPTAYPMHQIIGSADYAKLDEDMRKASSDSLAELAKPFADWPGGVRTIVRDGFPSAEVAACAEDEKADLIAIATHGRTGVRHLLLGSSTEAVLRAAKCPVLVVR